MVIYCCCIVIVLLFYACVICDETQHHLHTPMPFWLGALENAGVTINNTDDKIYKKNL
jgi:hypothetical protein